MLRRLIEDDQVTSAAHLSARGLPESSRTHRRDISHIASVTPLQRLVARACVPSSVGACLDYFDALDWVLDDGVITPEEQTFLDEIIRSTSLTDSQVRAMQESYLKSLIQAVERDSVVSSEELALVTKIATVLGIKDVSLPRITKVATTSRFKKGQRICFTGTAVDGDGNHLERSALENMAAAAGLQPVNGVSRKSCDLLVAADVTSSSGKAKKARDLGIPILGISEFLDLVME